MQRFIIVVPKDDGGVEVYPMKEWLRRHPEHIPPGVDPSSNSRHLGRSLRRAGWSVQETPDEVRLIFPGGSAARATIETVLGEEDALVESDDSEASFGLEYQLRDFIAQNISAINVDGRRLRLYTDTTGRDGIEFPTAVGFIDILAIDESGTFYVFELKRARSPDYTIGQLARYMGWVQHTIASGRPVNGIIVAKEITDTIRYAVSVVPNVYLFEYEVKFTLKSANDLVPSHG